MRIFRFEPEPQEEDASLILMCAIPGHGKTTLLQNLIARDILRTRRPAEIGTWPYLQREWVPPQIHAYDPKREIGRIGTTSLKKHFPQSSRWWRKVWGDRILDDFPQLTNYYNATAAAQAALDSDFNGILVVEELLTVRKNEFNILTEIAAMRRTSVEGKGLRIYATTQRPYLVPVAFRALADKIYCGQMIEQRDMLAMRPLIGEKADQLRGLKPGQWGVWDNGSN